MRAAPRPLEQRRRRGPTETGQAGTKWKKQNFGCKTRVEETRGSAPTGPWAQRSQGWGPGTLQVALAALVPGLLPSPSPDWQADCDQPREPQRPGRPGERKRPPAGVGGGDLLYIVARPGPAQRAGRRAPLRRVPAPAVRPSATARLSMQPG